MKERWHWPALVALVLVVFADPLLTGRVFFYRDLGNLMHPVIGAGVEQARALEMQPLSLWTHLLSNGRPMLANPGYALLAPASILYGVLPFDFAFDAFLVAQVLIGSLGMALLARRLGASPAAAFAAGAAYGLGGGMISGLALYWTSVAAAWAPWVLAAGHAAAERPSRGRIALLALALGVQALGGMPEVILATLVAGAALSLATVTGSVVRRCGVTALTWGASGVWGILIAAVNLVPATLHARTTIRALGFTTKGLLANSLDPRALPGFLLPRWGGSPMARLAGDFPGGAWTDTGTPYLISHHLGIVAVVLAVLGVVVLVRDGRRALALAFAVPAILGVVLALGRFVPGLEGLLDALALKSPLRYPVKALYITFVTIPPLTALGLDAVVRRSGARLATLLALAVAADLVVAHRGFAPTIDAAELAEPPLSLELKARAKDLGAADNQWRVHHERLPGGAWGENSPVLEKTEQAQYAWRRRVLLPPIGAAFGIHQSMESSGDFLDDIPYFTLTRDAYLSPKPEWARALGRAGVLFVLSPHGDLEEQTQGVLRFEKTLGVAERVPEHSVHLYRNEAWRPRASLPSGRVTAFTEADLFMRLNVKAEVAETLTLSDAFGDLAAWTAKIDDEPATLRRVEGAFVAIDVPPGGHVIDLRYVPRGFFPALVVSLLAFTAALVTLKFTIGTRRQPG